MSKFCDLDKNIKHVGEVSTSRVDGSPTGAEILTSTNAVTGDVRDTLDGKLKKMDQQFQDRFNTLAPIPWAPNTEIKANQSLQVFENDELFYLPNVKKLPFTTGATFNTDNWVLSELVTTDALTSYRKKTIVNIVDFGGGESIANNADAYNKVIAKYGYNVSIKFPKFGNGVYNFNINQYIESVKGLVLDIDNGVTFNVTGTYIPFLAKDVKVTKHLKIHLVDSNYNFYLSPETYKKFDENLYKLDVSSSEISTSFTVNPSTTCVFSDLSISTNERVDLIPHYATSTTVTFKTKTNKMSCFTHSANAGDEMHCYTDGTQGFDGSFSVAAITDEGYAVIYNKPTDLVITMLEFSNSGKTEKTTQYTAPTSAYSIDKSMIGVRVNSKQSFSLMINGVAFATLKTKAFILSAGFGAGYNNQFNTITFASPSMVKGKKSASIKPLNICCIGDSTSDENIPCSQYDYMRQYLAGCSGCQVFNYKNLAVSGENSAQQLARLQAFDLTGFDYLLIDIGINDIQGGVGVNDLINNISTMVTLANAKNVMPIVGIPTMWYSQAEAQAYGQDGANTLNSDKGSQYRAALIAWCGSNNVALNMNTINNMGSVSPQFLADGYFDSVVMDNIHPTAYGRQVRGLGWARSVVGDFVGMSYVNDDFRSIPDDWCSISNTVSYKRGCDSTSFAGSITVDGVASGTEIMKLKDIKTPIRPITIVCAASNTSSGVPDATATIQVKSDGSLIFYGSCYFVYIGNVEII